MRALRPWLAGLGLIAFIWLIGPLGLLGVVALVLLRAHIPRPSIKAVGVVAVLCMALTVVALTRAPGSLSIPPGAGWLTSSSYDGRAVRANPVPTFAQPQHPHLAANGKSSMHNDGWATDAYSWAGPVGKDVEVTSALYGILECATVAFDSHGQIVGLCGDISGPSLHLISPETLRILKTRGLPRRMPSNQSRLKDLCGGAYFYLDEHDQAVVATTDARIAVFETKGLTQVASYPVSVPKGDCLIALMPDWQGRIWYATRHGQVGWVAPGTSKHGEFQVKGTIANSLAVDSKALYVVSDHEMVRVRTDGPRPRLDWSTSYDRGTENKVGQLSQGSGTTPTLIGDNKLAITDNASPRMRVLVLDRRTGKVTCKVPVFARGSSATENSLVGVGDWVFVENNEGYAGPWSTLLGQAASPGIARVDTKACKLSWTAQVSAPTSVPKASAATGLLYVYEKQPNLWGVNAWYLTAIDMRTGKRAFRVRTGIGTLFNNHYAAISLAPDGSAYIATLAGMIKVKDGS